MTDRPTPLLPPAPSPIDAKAPSVLARDPYPWERQATDTEESWEKFQVYLLQRPPRRIIGPGMGHSARAVELYRENNWKARAEAYDKVMNAIVVEERAAFLAITARQHAADHMIMLRDAFEVTAREIQKQLASSRASNMPLMKPAELIKWTEQIVKLQRLVVGEVTERVEGPKLDLSKLSAEDLKALDAAVEEQEGEPEEPGEHVRVEGAD